MILYKHGNLVTVQQLQIFIKQVTGEIVRFGVFGVDLPEP